MLNLDQLMAAQKAGNTLIESLSPDELLLLQNYCLLTAKTMIVTGSQNGRGVTDITVNVLRNGIALGLATDIKDKKLNNRGLHENQ
jgi:hypothetical protein